MRISATLLAVVLAAGCSDDPEPQAPPPPFPADYADSYAEVRDCRKSGDHDLSFVRILADPRAAAPYQNRSDPFPDGAVVLKEEYEFGDDTCSGEILQWTVMMKAHAATAELGWKWQRVDAQRRVAEENPPRCQNCHIDCSGGSAIGYDYTCAEP
ncbi:MAG TPA: cytochrome P460 family protein [Polyangiaceae bacterium]